MILDKDFCLRENKMSKRGHNYPGFWVNFEAGEGAGKGTQQRLLVEYFRRGGFVVQSGREPGTTPAGEALRRLLQDPSLPELNPRTEMLGYVMAGIEFFEQLIKPPLERGEIYITDRWRYSTEAYQGHGLGIDLDIIRALTKFSCGGAYPDITFLLDIEPEAGLSRITGNEFQGNRKDKIESRGLDFHKRVNQGYREIARQNPDRFRVIPYLDGKPDEMHKQIRAYVEEYIKENGLEKVLARG